MSHQPAINFVEDPFHIGSAVVIFEVLSYPIDKVILKHALDQLMEEVRRNELMDVRPVEIGCIWLVDFSFGIVRNVRNHIPERWEQYRILLAGYLRCAC